MDFATIDEYPNAGSIGGGRMDKGLAPNVARKVPKFFHYLYAMNPMTKEIVARNNRTGKSFKILE